MWDQHAPGGGLWVFTGAGEATAAIIFLFFVCFLASGLKTHKPTKCARSVQTMDYLGSKVQLSGFDFKSFGSQPLNYLVWVPLSYGLKPFNKQLPFSLKHLILVGLLIRKKWPLSAVISCVRQNQLCICWDRLVPAHTYLFTYICAHDTCK